MQSDYILHESNFEPGYEKLGIETIDGRQTVKYRVTASSSNDAIPASDRVIWVDEVLGMPVKTELIHREGMRSSRVQVQLTDIRTEVDLTQFEIPSDYRKVKASQIFDLIARGARTTPAEKPQE
jgi:outer membrane lipoprotein-sorting protein